jgi:hypothetical protein
MNADHNSKVREILVSEYAAVQPEIWFRSAVLLEQSVPRVPWSEGGNDPALVLACRDSLEVIGEQQLGEHMRKLPIARLRLPSEPGGKAPRIRYHITPLFDGV